MGIKREKETDKGRGGEPTKTPPPDLVESNKPRIVRVDNLVRKDELSLYQGAADGLTQVGLGEYRFSVAEEQVIPATGTPLGKDSPYIAVVYVGQENRERLWELIYRAENVKQKLEREGKSTEDIEQGVQAEIKAGIGEDLQREDNFRALLDSLQRTPKK